MKNDSNSSKISSPAELLEIAVGYQKSQTLFTLAELRVPDLLSKKNLTAAVLAEKLKIHPLAMERFLNACVSIGLLQKTNELFANSSMTEEFLVEKSENYLGGQMKRYQNRSYPQWQKLTENLEKWEFGETNDEIPEDEDQGDEALDEQHNLAVLHGRALAESYDFSKVDRLLDLGGGTAGMSIGLCEELPHLQMTVFDLRKTRVAAEKKIRAKGFEKRIEYVSGDILKDDLPGNFEVCLLANLLAVFDAETNKELFKRIYEKLPVGGIVLISGWILDASHTSPVISALFCLEDICWDAPDVERSSATYTNWLEDAGFQKIEAKTYFEPTKLISAVKV